MMRTLSNHLLVYDKYCPLCCWYTGLFIKYKLLDEHSRVAYQDIDSAKYPTVDYIIAQNKIALINTQKGNVIYGIDAISIMLSIPFPFVGFFIKFKPIHWFMEKFYMLVSMNRKIIIPVNCNKDVSCSSSRSWFWRWLFVVLCALTVNVLVGNYFTTHLSSYFIGNPLYGDTIYFAIQLGFQYLMCLLFKEKNRYDYLGQIAFVSFLGAVILAFCGMGLTLVQCFNINISMLQPFCYGMVFAWMFMEHRRRILISEMDWRLSYTWIFVRILMYPLAFTVN